MKSRKIYQEEEGPSYNDPPYPPDTGYLSNRLHGAGVHMR